MKTAVMLLTLFLETFFLSWCNICLLKPPELSRECFINFVRCWVGDIDKANNFKQPKLKVDETVFK